MFSLRPFTPGRSAQMPRTIRSICDAGLRGRVERLDDAGLEQRIHLGDDVRGAAGGGVLGLAMDQADEAFGQGERRDQQRGVVVGFGVRGEVVEDSAHAGGDLRIGGQQAQVGVEARGDGVVVAGAEVAVAARRRRHRSRRTSRASLQCVLRPTMP